VDGYADPASPQASDQVDEAHDHPCGQSGVVDEEWAAHGQQHEQDLEPAPLDVRVGHAGDAPAHEAKDAWEHY